MSGGAGGYRPRVRMVTIQSSTKPSYSQNLQTQAPRKITKLSLNPIAKSRPVIRDRWLVQQGKYDAYVIYPASTA